MGPDQVALVPSFVTLQLWDPEVLELSTPAPSPVPPTAGHLTVLVVVARTGREMSVQLSTNTFELLRR